MYITLELPSGKAQDMLIRTVVQVINTCAASGKHKICPNFRTGVFPQEYMKFFAWTDEEQSMLYIKLDKVGNALQIEVEGMYFHQLLEALTRNVNAGILPAVTVSA